MQLELIQQALQGTKLDGWLLYDFRDLNPISGRIAGFQPEDHHSRRWFCLVPRQGEPIWLHAEMESHLFTDRRGSRRPYVSWRDLETGLKQILDGSRRIAMEYSPGNAIPYVSRVDAGTIELVRGCGVEIESSADLVSAIEATWSEEGLTSHRRAAERLTECARTTHLYIAECARRGETPSEYRIQQRMADQLRSFGMTLDGDPIVAVGANSASPHYRPLPDGSTPIVPDSVVLLDLWGREDRPGSICADITWMAYLGETIPAEVQEVWTAVSGARNAAVEFLVERYRAGRQTFGYEVDDVARGFLKSKKLDGYFIHRLGHSIGTVVHANGANLDHLETRDERVLIPHTGFSVEPGVYLPGRFGVRSEIDVYLGESGPEVTTPMQEQIPALLA